MASRGTFRLASNGPFSFDHSVGFYRRSKFEMVDIFGDDLFVRPLECDGIPVIIRVRGNAGVAHRLCADWSSPSDNIDRHKLREMIARMFYLDFDIERFYDHAKDDVMKDLTGRFVGFRPILTPSIYEAAAWAIIGQQVNLQFAYTIKNRLVQKINRRVKIEGQKYYLFPRPEEVIGLSHEDLLAMKFSGRKAEYLLDFTRMITGGEFDLNDLTVIDYDTAIDRLLAIRGIGIWSANYILMRGAGHRDAFPIGDSGLTNAIRRQYNLDSRPDAEFVATCGEAWRPYRTLACFYLWKSLQGGA